MMYGLPDDFDPASLVGRRLSAVTYAENVIVVAFGDDCIVSVSGDLGYRTGYAAPAVVERAPVAETSLVALIGRTIERVDLRSPRDCVLCLGQGASISLLDASDSFESYLLEIDGRTIVV